MKACRLANISITARLVAVIVVFATVIVALLVIVSAAFAVETGVRAYVGGEGIWSKGQKDAVYYLSRYTRSHDPRDYHKFREAMLIPLGDHQARLALEAPGLDYVAAERGFIDGGNPRANIPYMIFLFRHGGSVSHMAAAIDIWRRADTHILELDRIGRTLNADILSGRHQAPHDRAVLDQIEAINAQLTPLERAFSKTLDEGARAIQAALLLAILASAALLLAGGTGLAWLLGQHLRMGIIRLHAGAIRVSHGDLDTRIEVRSADELGQLTAAFNGMIARRREAEDTLRGATEFREKVMESATNAIYALDLEGRFTLVNRRACEITGFSADQLLGQSYRKLYSPDDVTRVDEQFNAAARNGQAITNFETPLRRSDGRPVTITFSIVPLMREGAIVGVVGTAEEITERKHMEEALIKEREFLRVLLENLADGIVACDETGTLTVFNRATREMHGLPPQPLAPERWAEHYDLYHADGSTLMTTDEVPLFRAFKGEPVKDLEMVIAPKHKPAHIIVCNGQALVAPSGRKLGAVVAMHDVTRQRESEKELAARAADLVRSNAELEQFAYVASHDLQSPLRSIVSFVQLLKRDYGEALGKDATEYMEFIAQSTRHMQRLVADLLAFSRVGRVDSTVASVNCEDLLAIVENQMRDVINARGVELSHDPLPTVTGVKSEIHQLFQNLIDNAIKFQPGEKPRVHVSARRDGTHWVVCVRDHGIGIKPEHKERIFKVFQRLHTADRFEGTGIGLAICQKIVQRHGGKIWVESEPGTGSVFCFTLPAAANRGRETGSHHEAA